MDLADAKGPRQQLKALAGVLNPAHRLPEIPENAEPRTGMSMGEHAQRTADGYGITQEEMGELAVASHHNLAEGYDEGFFDDLVMPYEGPARSRPPTPRRSPTAPARCCSPARPGPRSTTGRCGPASSTPRPAPATTSTARGAC